MSTSSCIPSVIFFIFYSLTFYVHGNSGQRLGEELQMMILNLGKSSKPNTWRHFSFFMADLYTL